MCRKECTVKVDVHTKGTRKKAQFYSFGFFENLCKNSLFEVCMYCDYSITISHVQKRFFQKEKSVSFLCFRKRCEQETDRVIVVRGFCG